MVENRDEYNIEGQATIDLQNLPGTVRVQSGPPGTVKVVSKGDYESLRETQVARDGPGFEVKGRRHSGVNIRNLSINSISGQPGGVIVTGGTVIQGAHIDISGDLNLSGDGIFVNGKPIEEIQADQSQTSEPRHLETVITVPPGTTVKAAHCNDLMVDDVRGTIYLDVSGNDYAVVNRFTSAAVELDGSAHFSAEGGSGTLYIEADGASRATISGDLDKAEATAEGAAAVSIHGDVRDLNAKASGASLIQVIGNVERQTVRKSGVGRVQIRERTVASNSASLS